MSSRRIRVVHLVSTLNIGGMEMVVLDLNRFADRSRFETRVLCLGEKGTLAPRLEALGIPVESVQGQGQSRTLLRLVRRLWGLGPHVLHTHNPAPHRQGVVAARLTGVPVVVHTKHGRNYPNRPRAVLTNRLLSYLTDRVVPVSRDAGQVARRIERLPARKVQVIRNGIDLIDFPARPASRGASGCQAVHVARLNVIKDQETLLRAVRLVVDALPSFQMHLLGDGPMRAELEALRDALRLGENVHFHGFRADVRTDLAAADLFVLSSLSEGISITLLEAMATGLPVVATAVGGNPEVVVHGQTGLLVQARSPEALAQAMLTILRNPETAARMGQAGRERVESEFDLQKIVQLYEALYLKLLKAKGIRIEDRNGTPVEGG